MSTIRDGRRSEMGPADSALGSLKELPTTQAASAPGVNVLLVEDDFLLRTVSAGTLSDLGYRPLEVADAQQALSMLSVHSDIQILITDVNLPGMDGKALAAEALRLRPDIRVLFVTGYSRKMVKDVDLPDGSTGYLSKPFQHRDLDQALRRLLS